MQLIPLTGTITTCQMANLPSMVIDATHTPHGDDNTSTGRTYGSSSIDATHTPHGDDNNLPDGKFTVDGDRCNSYPSRGRKHKALRLCVKAHGLRAFVLSEKNFSVIPENLLLFDD